MASLSHSSSNLENSAEETLYFAYGSNMYLPQMAVRCGDSMLYGRGVLRKYKWQTNSLGGGNVVKASPEDFVEGILFTVSPKDVETLRRYEGTAWQYFVEEEVEVEVELVSDTALQARNQKPAEVADFLTHHNSEFNLKLTGPKSVSHSTAVASTHLSGTSNGGKTVRKALVYLSYKYSSPGDIRDEYVVRMHLALAYARLLGVSKTYLESLYPRIFGKRVLSQQDG